LAGKGNSALQWHCALEPRVHATVAGVPVGEATIIEEESAMSTGAIVVVGASLAGRVAGVTGTAAAVTAGATAAAICGATGAALSANVPLKIADVAEAETTATPATITANVRRESAVRVWKVSTSYLPGLKPSTS
jgi:hypothetical protein